MNRNVEITILQSKNLLFEDWQNFCGQFIDCLYKYNKCYGLVFVLFYLDSRDRYDWKRRRQRAALWDLVPSEEVAGHIYTPSQLRGGQGCVDRHHRQDPVEAGAQKQRCVSLSDFIVLHKWFLLPCNMNIDLNFKVMFISFVVLYLSLKMSIFLDCRVAYAGDGFHGDWK